MAEHTNEPTTYHANIVTTYLNVDEMTIEFRHLAPPHREIARQGGPREELTEEEIYQIEPVVRVIVTFSAAQAMREMLNEIVPQIEAMRKGQ